MKKLGYVPALDGIRGIAIAFVVGLHFFNLPPGGGVGVDLFFVLSGFLITTLLLEERAETGTVRLRSFYMRRVRRLFPALAGMLIVYLIATAAVGEDNLLPAAAGAFYVANILGALGNTMLFRAHLFGLWSLAQEEQFYLVWPTLLLFLARSRRLLTWVMVMAAGLTLWRIALIVHGAPAYRIFNGPDTRSTGLLAGAALAIWRQRHPEGVGEWAGKVGVCGVAAGACFGWAYGGWPLWFAAAFEGSAVLLIAAAVSATELARGLGWSPLVWLGRRSYSLYLWHVPAALGLAFLFRDAGFHPPLFEAKLVAVVAAVTAAHLSYHVVEQPFRRRRAKPVIATAEPVRDAVAASVMT